MCDSNGKHIDLKRLFPGREAVKLWTATTKKASEQLSKQRYQDVEPHRDQRPDCKDQRLTNSTVAGGKESEIEIPQSTNNYIIFTPKD